MHCCLDKHSYMWSQRRAECTCLATAFMEKTALSKRDCQHQQNIKMQVF